MKNFKVVVTSPSFSKNPVLRQELLDNFPESEFNESGRDYAGEDLVKFLSGADAAIIGLSRINDEILETCDSLKLISKYGVGLDNIDLEACKRRGIPIGWTGGTNRLSVAEEALCFMIGLSRNIFATGVQLKQGKWNKNGGNQLSGKTVGIIGVGNVGKELIRLLKPFNCTILVNDIIDQSEYYLANNLIEVSKKALFAQSDIISLHTPLTSETRYMINSESLGLMKDTAFLINTSRGEVVCEADLKDALIQKRIAGAALDVFEVEPPSDLEFLSLPNLFCTPHIGGNAVEGVTAMGLSAIEHLKRFFLTEEKSLEYEIEIINTSEEREKTPPPVREPVHKPAGI
jgi:phosphoglycerate dehydrogenase-like enzyme